MVNKRTPTATKRARKKNAKRPKTRTRRTNRKGAKRAARPRSAKKAKARARKTASARTRAARAAADDAAEVGQAVVVVEMSNNGPHDIRAITVDQVHVFENISTSSARSEFDISEHFNPPTRIGWEIFAGMQFPRAGVFLERPDKATQTLGQQAPLKKGAPWLDEKEVK